MTSLISNFSGLQIPCALCFTLTVFLLFLVLAVLCCVMFYFLIPYVLFLSFLASFYMLACNWLSRCLLNTPRNFNQTPTTGSKVKQTELGRISDEQKDRYDVLYVSDRFTESEVQITNTEGPLIHFVLFAPAAIMD
jgi:hypothetical protein